jgi:hypothetical protein
MSTKIKSTVTTVKISEITQELFVRERLDDDRVWYWAERFEKEPESVNPIEVTQENSLTDGRHRIAGALLADKTEIRAIVFPVKNRLEQIKRAFESNISADSPKPPTKGDAILTIKQLIHERCKKSDILDIMVKMFPLKTATSLYDEARHGIYRDTVRDAKRAVLDDGLGILAAAAQYGIDPDKLREEMGGKKRKTKVGPGDFNRDLNSQYRSHGQKVRSVFTKLEKLFDEGEISKDSVLQVYDYAINSAKQKLRDLTDKKTRMEKM